MARPVLRTERIELRPMKPEHLPLLHRLDSDPEVMRHLLGRARHRDLAQEAALAWLDWARRAAVAPYLIAVIHPANAAPWSPAVVYRHDLS